MKWFTAWRARLHALLWDPPPPDAAPGRETLVLLGRIAFFLVRDVWRGRYSLRAKSLVYTTLLALVPMLALAFFALKSVGIHKQLEPALLEFVAPLGDKGASMVHQTLAFVGELKLGVLGVVGIVFLVYTAMSLLVQLEVAFNDLWRVERERSLVKRVGGYLAVLLFGPVLVVSALSAAAWAFSAKALQTLFDSGYWGTALAVSGKSVSLALLVAAITLAYVFIPNTRVRWMPALCGALLAGVSWQLAGSVFASLVVTSAAYAAFYSGFAIVILFLIWLYVSWLILLFGAQTAYIVQHPDRAAQPNGAAV